MLNDKIYRHLGQQLVTADLGIEVEAEFIREPKNASGWMNHDDGSLRGYSREYVTPPIGMGEVDTYLKSLYKATSTNGQEIVYSFRAGVHVHMNCQNMTTNDLIKLVMLYYLFEIPLTDFCGEDRVGNSFCLRGVDAEESVNQFIYAIRNRDLTLLNTDNIRYSALNFKSIPRYGTVEFRAMGTYPNLDKVKEWIDILFRLRDYSKGFENSGEILAKFSESSVEDFTKEVFGDLYDTFFPEGVDSEEIYAGLELAQDIKFFAV